MKKRLAVSLTGLAITAISTLLAGQPLHAQAVSQPPVQGTGLSDLLANPGHWLTKMFNAALLELGQRATADVIDFMNAMLGSGNLISQTPPGLSYANDAVIHLWEMTTFVANAGLAVVTVWGGVNIMMRQETRAPYHGALELIPRVVLSAILVNTSRYWGHFVIDLNNAVCQALGAASIPGWTSVLKPGNDAPLLDLIAIAIYLIMGMLLLGQMLMRLALVDALLVIGPLALLCWVLPQTYSWARLWFSTFFGTVFAQSLQVLVLQLGTELIQSLPGQLPSIAADPLAKGQLWLVTLLLGISILQLARKVPALMPGYPSGGSTGYASGLVALRFISSLVRPSRGSKGGK